MTRENKEKLHIYIKKVVYFWLGISLIVIGLVGIIMPVLPGIIPIFFGLGLIKRSQHEYSEHRIINFLDSLKIKFKNRKPSDFRLKPKAKLKPSVQLKVNL